MSWTAEIIYSLLLYRAQLSKKNRWIDSEGRIYIQFSNASLAKALHKSETPVRNALRELEKAGLIEKRLNAGSANTIYLKLPDSSESQSKPCLKTNTPPHRKTDTPSVQKQTPPCLEMDTGSVQKQTPKYKELDNRTVNSKREKAPTRQSYGSYGNVLLTDAEYQKLSADIPYLDNLRRHSISGQPDRTVVRLHGEHREEVQEPCGYPARVGCTRSKPAEAPQQRDA